MTSISKFKYDVVILGAGPAGYSASIYCARANLSCCIIDTAMAGGRPLSYLEIENYLGLGKTSTFDMLEKFREHVELFNIPIFECEEIFEVDLDNKLIRTSSGTYEGTTIIIATGSKPRILNVPGEREFTGRGVHYCAICDGHFYKDKVVAVIGGGNSACEEALGLAKICKKVYIIQVMKSLSCDEITKTYIAQTENIQVICNAEVASIVGTQKVSSIYISKTEGDLRVYQEILVDAVFPYIGFTPNSDIFNLEKDAQGFICSNACMQTSTEGIFVAGDVRAKVLRQVVTAVADGAVAAVEASKFVRRSQC